MKRFGSALLALVGLISQPGQAMEMKPVVDAELLGGQNFYNGADSTLGAVTNLTLAPYMKFNDQWSLVPLYHGNYNGTVQVTDLLGGGTVINDSQDHTLSTKVIRSFQNGLSLKAVGGYGIEFLRETSDESWGKGLYDNRRLFGGAEAEWSWAKDRYVRLAYDNYQLSFPNYQSLESQQASAGLGREFNQPDVLNNGNNAVTLGTRVGLPFDGYADLAAIYTYRQYGDQHLVVETGSLIDDTRNDQIQTLSAMGTWPIWSRSDKRLISTLGYSWSHLFSNQNHYDATQIATGDAYNANYYAYLMQTLSNQWTYLWGNMDNPWSLNLTGSIAHQKYSDRFIQDDTGAYGTDITFVNTAYVGLGFSYPIAQGFRLEANTYFGWSNSNNEYNQVYQYHYNTQTYLMGFSYAY